MTLPTNLTPVEYSAQRVLTTEQLAQAYECDANNIKKNFNANKERFEEGKHYFKLEGEELSKLRVTFGDLQISPMTRTLYLWTKRGAARHSKMLGTDKAWEVFEALEESYFEHKQSIAPPVVDKNFALYKLVRDVGKTAETLQQYFDVSKGISLATATAMVEDVFKVDLTPLKKLIPSADHDIGTLTPTEIGKQINLSSRKVNERLIEKGLQVKDGKDYRLTEEGKKFAEALPYTRNGHSGYQIKWSAKTVNLLVDNAIH